MATKGTTSVSTSNVEWLGHVTPDNTHAVRDGGSVGWIGNNVFITYGDTMYMHDDNTLIPGAMVSSSIAKADLSNPLSVAFKLSDQYPAQFGPVEAAYHEDMSSTAMGASNVVGIDENTGITFLIKNNRPGGVNHIIGGAPARVDVVNGMPSATRVADTWWDGATEPMYGGMNVIRANLGDGDFIYAFGNCPYGGCSANLANNMNVYVARVSPENAFDLGSYQYWNGQHWQSERLINPTDTEAVFWAIGNGQIIWSPYYDQWLFIYNDAFADNQIWARTSTSLVGAPWSDAVLLYKATPPSTPGFHNAYSVAANRHYDMSAETLIVTYCMDPNDIQAIKVTFQK
ncbi:MAG: hypothetical protein M1828_002657 [Chrysothrix sp. TS-e1954]|nr:MAG: hypothetical protein M1828_002657 [Chrysothrix sp. TS-e1954]